MNVLPQGIFTVVVATVIASVLILFTGNSVADSDSVKSINTDVTKTQNIEVSTGDATSNQAATSSMQIGATSKKVEPVVLEAVKAPKLSMDTKKNKMKLPPPGPFQFVRKEEESKVSADAPKAPEKQPLDTVAPDKPKMEVVVMKQLKLAVPMPKLEVPEPNMTGVAPALSAMPVKVAVPDFNMTIPSIPNENGKSPALPTIKQTAPIFTRPNTNVQQFMPNQPIWMQAPPTFSGGAPSFQAMAPQIPRQMQNAPSRGQAHMAPSQNTQAFMQGMNMRQGQQQQYMYVPAYPPRVYYPQMPRYNNYPQNMNNFMPHGHEQGGNMMGTSSNNYPKLQHNQKQNTGVKTQ